MNSYNENLHSTVVTTLAAQELEQKTMKASLDASMFTLYYAGGARMTAAEKLRSDQVVYSQQQRLKDQAVINNNIAVNLLAAANEEKSYVAQSVTNTSVAAANIQIASNAILKLAGNAGSIYSMVSAADFDSDIYLQSKEAYRLMKKTAFDAERVSQMAMEASALTAGVSSGIVADEAQATATAISTLYKAINTGFDVISSAVAADNAQLSATSESEKVAEGTVESLNVEYFAARNAYQLNNKELNIDLRVPEGLLTNDSYTVSFNFYKSAFAEELTEESGVLTELKGYPVSNYYIMLVKENQRSTFTISNAESIISSKDSGQYVKIEGKHKPDETGISKKIYISGMNDSDNDKMVLGEKYVVFVLAELMTEYKKNINDFSDYLSAPSTTFALTNKLSSPAAKDISVDGLTLTFTLQEYSFYKVDYRCMFLPVTNGLVKGLLSEQGLRTIEGEVERLERIAEKYNPKIAELEVGIASLQSDYDAKASQLKEIRNEEKTAPPKEKLKLEEEAREIEAEMISILSEISEKNAELKVYLEEKEKAISKIDPSVEARPGFFFNLKIAEQVDPGNYKLATMKEDEKDKGKDKDKNKHAKKSYTGTLVIDDTVTDNFGNPLMEGISYIPVILSAANPARQDVNQFTNSLSAYAETKDFTYLSMESINE